MGRWEPGARQRLQTAAWELFQEAGFAEATVPAITARAGLTTRTFFRYFTDKREVLFAGDAQYVQRVADLVAAAPEGTGAMDLITSGLPLLADQEFEGLRGQLRTRRAIIAADEGLRERDLLKQAALVGAIEDAVRARDIDPLTAALVAQVGVAVFGTALRRWLEVEDERSLSDHIGEALTALDGLIR